MSAIAQSVVVHFGDDNACFRATDVDYRKQVFRLTSHGLRVLLVFFAATAFLFGDGPSAAASELLPASAFIFAWR